jgi:mRNA interferase RelE/StbE
MRYEIRLSNRAARDLDGLDRRARQRIDGRLEQLAADPSDRRFSKELTNQRGLRSSRVGGWRIIFKVDGGHVFVVMIERRGQVYRRI